MRVGLIASIVVHLVIIGWGLISLGGAPLDASNIETVPIELVDIADITDLERGKTSAEAAETPSPNDPTEKAAETPPENELAGDDKPTPPPPPPPPPPPEAAPPEAAEAEAETPPPAEAEPEAISETAAEESPTEAAPPKEVAAAPPSPRIRPDRPAPQAPPTPEAPETSDTFTEDIAALIDRSATGTAQAPSSSPATLGVSAGNADAKMTQSEIDALRSQITRCWVIPQGWTSPREVTVSVRFQLKPDGTVAGMPEVVEYPASQYGPVAGDNAIRAVMQCGPYALPAEKYDQWKDVQLRFTPQG
jgi:hypothetical protein